MYQKAVLLTPKLRFTMLNPWIHPQTLKTLERRAEIHGNSLKEVCGYFFSSFNGEVRIVFCANRTAQPMTHLLWRRDVLPAFSRGPFWGAFHSHPVSDAKPSAKDIEKAFWGPMIMIYSDIYSELAIWRRSGVGLVRYDVESKRISRPGARRGLSSK